MKVQSDIKNFINFYRNPLKFEGSLGAVRSRIFALNGFLSEKDQLPPYLLELLIESKQDVNKYKLLRTIVPQRKDENYHPTGKYRVYDLLIYLSQNAQTIMEKFSEIDSVDYQSNKEITIHEIITKATNYPSNNVTTPSKNDLTLDNDYPYPIKTNSSIWTVKSKHKKK